MDQSILQIILTAKDQASAKIKEIGTSLDKTGKKAMNLSDAFKLAGGVMLGAGLIGVGAMKMFYDAAAQHQTVMASVKATLDNLKITQQGFTDTTGTSTGSVKENKKAIRAQIQELELQKSQLSLNNQETTQSITVTTGHGKTLKEHTKLIHQNATETKSQVDAIDQQILALKQSELGTGSAITMGVGYTKAISDSVLTSKQLYDITNQVADSYIKLGFNENDTAQSFAQDLRITGNLTDARKMLAASADFARLKGIDLATANSQLIMGFNGEAVMLKRMGIELPKNAKGMEVLTAVEKAAAGQTLAFADTAQGAQDRLNATFDKFKTIMGDQLLNSMKGFMNGISGVMDKFNKLKPSTVAVIMNILKFGSAFLILAGGFTLAIGFASAFMGAVASITPIILPLIAIFIAVGLAAYLIYTHWNQLVQGFNAAKPYIDNVIKSLEKFWTSVQPKIKIAIADITKVVQKLTQNLEKFWKEHGAAIMKQVKEIWDKTVVAFNAISAVVMPVMQGLLALVVLIVGAIYLWISSHWDQIYADTKFIFDVIVAVIKVALDILTGVFKLAGDFMTGNWKKALSDTKDLFVNIWNDIKQVVKDAINSLIGYIDNLIHGANAIGSKIHLPKIPDIPHFETGGYVPNTGIAMLHQGEFVLSKSMLAGKQPVPAYANTTNNTKNMPINIYATINQDMDLNKLGAQIQFAINNTR